MYGMMYISVSMAGISNVYYYHEGKSRTALRVHYTVQCCNLFYCTCYLPTQSTAFIEQIPVTFKQLWPNRSHEADFYLEISI